MLSFSIMVGQREFIVRHYFHSGYYQSKYSAEIIISLFFSTRLIHRRLLGTRDHLDPEHLLINVASAVSTKSRFFHQLAYRVEMQHFTVSHHSMDDQELHIDQLHPDCHGPFHR